MRKILLIFCSAIVLLAVEQIPSSTLISPSVNNAIKPLVNQSQNQGNLDSFYKSLSTQTTALDSSNTLKPYIDAQKKEYDNFNKNQNEYKSFTIFYFISEDTSPELIRSFAADMRKLKQLDPNIDSLLITRGLVGGNFDNMAKYVQKLQSMGIEGIDVTFHPWAFDYFKLDRVPAFALSYCKKDFRFKTCEHKFLTRGEISLTNFFEIISDEDIEYKKYFQKLIEAK